MTTLALLTIVVVISAPSALLYGGVGNIVAATGVVGLPLLYGALGLVLLVSAAGWSAASRHVPDARGLYTYAGRGLGPAVGLGVGALGLLAYLAMTVAQLVLVGEELLRPLVEAGLSVRWWMITLPLLLLVGLLGMARFAVRVGVLAAVVVVQIPGILLLDAAVLVSPGPDGRSAAALDPVSLFSGSVGAALGFLALTYVGVEVAWVLRREAGASRRAAGRATVLGVGGSAVLYVTSTWLMTVLTGPGNVVVAARANPISLVPDTLEADFGSHAAAAFFVVTIASTVGAALAFHSLAARHLQAVAADGLLPGWLAKESGPHHLARRASAAVTLVSLVAVLAMAGAGIDDERQVNGFLLMSHLGALSAVLMLVLVFLGIATYFLRSESESDGFFGWEGVLIATLTGGVTLATVLGLAIAETDHRLRVPSASVLTWLLPALAAAVFFAGVVRAQFVRRWRPDLLAGLTGRRRLLPQPETSRGRHAAAPGVSRAQR